MESTDEEIRNCYHQLGRAKFAAIEGGRRINVDVGQHKRIGGFRMPSIDGIYRGGPALVAENELYVSWLERRPL